MSQNNNNNNNNNNEEEELEFIFDSEVCNEDIKILNPKSAINIKYNGSTCFIVGKYEFKANTGIYRWTSKVTNLSHGLCALVGVVEKDQIKNFKNCNDKIYNNTFSVTTNGIFYNRSLNLNYSKVDILKINYSSSSIMVAELNTNNGKLNIKSFDISGVQLYFDYTFTTTIPFPCQPVVFLSYFNNKYEVVQFTRSDL
eukprot:TRINITY_DN6323_c1_g5_i1.p1 TRINITY_DN6323_c1_g5~~TRINITY_DN6323_c1_g5_i1.p1  ORF type:complete len:198 (+),score=41.57 TRINITY_DN6323_c1_g5_i1:14-607(+)